MKIKLLLVVPTLAAGGSEKIISLLANNIKDERIDVTLAVLDNNNKHQQIHEYVNIIYLNTPRVSNSIFKLYKLIKKYDVVISTLTHLNIILAFLKIFLPKKNKIIARESVILSINNHYQPYPRIFNFAVKNLYRFFDKIICQSNDMLSDLRDNYSIRESQLIKINNPVLKPDLVSIPVSYSTTSFLTVARLVYQKGIDRILDALALCNEISFEYHIVGDGPERENIQKKIEELHLEKKVILHGSAPSNDYYVNADFYLFGSRVEGFPNVLLEAGSFGIPVIAFSCPGGINEIMDSSTKGICINSNSSFDFAEAIKKALHTKYDRKKIEEETLAEFNIDKIILQYESLIISVAQAK